MQIIRVTYPQNFQGKAFKMAYVEFGDEEAMKAGLEKHAEASPCYFRVKDEVFIFLCGRD